MSNHIKSAVKPGSGGAMVLGPIMTRKRFTRKRSKLIVVKETKRPSFFRMLKDALTEELYEKIYLLVGRP